MLLSRDGMLGKSDCLILIGVFFAFLLYTALNAGKLQSGELTGGPQKSMLRVAVCFIIGITAVVIGSKLLVKNGAELARLLGVSDDVISLTIIALGTSLPELVTAITALRKKNADIGIGNIIGANILNGTMVLGVSGLVSPIAVTSSNLTHDFPAAAILSVLLLAPIVFRKKSEIWQGILMLGIYISYLIILI